MIILASSRQAITCLYERFILHYNLRERIIPLNLSCFAERTWNKQKMLWMFYNFNWNKKINQSKKTAENRLRKQSKTLNRTSDFDDTIVLHGAKRVYLSSVCKMLPNHRIICRNGQGFYCIGITSLKTLSWIMENKLLSCGNYLLL